jgi:hypothetical protein
MAGSKPRASLLPPLCIRHGRIGRFIFVLLPLLASVALHAGDYTFDAKISEPTLRNYLSRSMTLMWLLSGHGDLDDNLRMMTNSGVKFAGRAVFQWGREEGGESALPQKLEAARQKAAKIHAADPDIILQACIFEIISRDAENLEIPAWAFEGLGRKFEDRKFKYDQIIYESGRGVNQWGQGASVPDVSRDETKLWFYFLAASYIDAGCEAIHYGQVELMNRNDPNLDHWWEVMSAARAYAAKHSRRHCLLCDAHVPRGGLLRDGKLLLDFHSFPLRIEEIPDRPRQAQLRVGFLDSLFGRSKGGVTPSGWPCEHLPYLVEFDNYGRSRHPGEAGQGPYWVWGWDEITWFSQLSQTDRDDWLRYAWKWVRENDPAGYVQMPGSRIISGALNGRRWYDVNNASAATPNGYGQEETIKQIWAADLRHH